MVVVPVESEYQQSQCYWNEERLIVLFQTIVTNQCYLIYFSEVESRAQGLLEQVFCH